MAPVGATSRVAEPGRRAGEERPSSAAPSTAGATTQKADWWRVWVLAFGHAGSDFYPAIIQPMLPILILAGRFTLTEAGIISLLTALSASLLQPVFGYISDKTGHRALVWAAPLWVGAFVSCLGLAPNIWIFVGLVLLGGIGTAAFHPQATAMASVCGGSQRAVATSVFQFGGNIGFGLGPLVVAWLATIGVENSVLLAPIGVITGALLFFWTPDPNQIQRKTVAGPPVSLWESVRPNLWGLILIVAVMALRSAVGSGLLVVFPLYLISKGMAVTNSQLFSSVVLLVGSAGAMFGARLADRYGYKLSMVVTMVTATPVLGYFAIFHPIDWWWAFAAVVGFCVMASSSLSVVMAQEILPRNIGIASGLILGFGFGVGGLLSAVYSITADHFGLEFGVGLLVVTPLLAAITAAAIPPRRDITPATPTANGQRLPASPGG